MTRRSLEKFANSTCRALQLTVVGLLGGVDVLLDQKRARHLDNNNNNKKRWTTAQGQTFSSFAGHSGEYRLTSRNPCSPSPAESSW